MPPRVTIWNHRVHERVAAIYPERIHAAPASALRDHRPGDRVACATLAAARSGGWVGVET